MKTFRLYQRPLVDDERGGSWPVFSDVKPSMQIAREEIFGPVLDLTPSPLNRDARS